MAISVIQRKSGQDNNGATGSIAAVFTSNITAGSAIIVCAAVANTTNSVLGTPSDTRLNTYTQIADFTDGTNFVGQRWWIAYGSSAGANTVTVSDSFTADNIHAFEVSGLAASAAFDKKASQVQVSNASADSTNTPATTNANELLIGVICDDVNDTYTVGTGYSNLTVQANTGFSSASEEKIVSATGAYNATATLGNANTVSLAVIMTFSDTAIASTTVYPSQYNRGGGVYQPKNAKPIIEMY